MSRVSLLLIAVLVVIAVVKAYPDGFVQNQEQPGHHQHNLVRRDESKSRYPCKRCFAIRKNKVTCTAPRCDEGYGCDDYSLRCFRMANLTNVRNDDDDN